MKKTRTILLFFCFFPKLIFSQTLVSVGIRGGINQANYKLTYQPNVPINQRVEPFQLRLLTLGMPIEFTFANKLILKTGLHFVQKGYEVSRQSFFSNGFSQITDKKLVSNWLEIPVLLKLSRGSVTEMGSSLFFGPSVSAGLTGALTTTTTNFRNGVISGGTLSDTDKLTPESPYFRLLDVALVVGVDVHYGGIFLDAYYQFGITKLHTDLGTKAAGKTRGLCITTGYQLPIFVIKKRLKT
jgi:Outer membrane protein beta-barrel domain